METDDALDECGCAPSPRERRVLWPAVSRRGALGFGAIALATLGAIGGPLGPTHRWASALGLGVAVNSLYWLFAWQKGTFTMVSRVLLAVALLLFTCFALYIGLQALSASTQGVSLLEA